MLKASKLLALRGAERLGLSRMTLDSSWRRRRLLILCYHSLSLADEHEWRPRLYMRQELLARRLELLQKHRCAILPLGEAITRLYNGELPPRSVAITFDDGTYDFYKLALPLFKRLGIPVTAYISTYYAEFNRPVFDPALAYLLWKAEGRTLDWPEVMEGPVVLNSETRGRVWAAAADYCGRRELDGRQKDELLADLAARTGQDYGSFCAARMFTLMNAAELREAAAAGVALELHTHRHRVYRDKKRLFREIDENRAWIEAKTGVRARHFCYPSGCYLPEFVPWLKEWGIASAVTCRAGLAGRNCDPMLLPRVVDGGHMPEEVFEGWITGVAAALPNRGYAMDMWALR